MKFIEIKTRIRASATERWNQFIKNLPFRMLLGRFGIRLMKIGRFLQVRYANWNSEFRLRLEYSLHNQDFCQFYVSEPVTMCGTLSFNSPEAQPNKMPTMVQELFGIKGIKEVVLGRYDVIVIKARVYGWGELLPRIEEILLRHLVTPS